MVDRDAFGDRMKLYERAESDRRLMPLLPAVARLDGRSFSTLTKHVERPFSERFHGVMVDVTRYLIERSNALAGYTQSDEITLVWWSTDMKSQIFFDGRIQKMVSTLAAMASVRLNEVGPRLVPGLPGWHDLPTFDCRVWNVPNETEAVNTMLWRQLDATKNSISMAARAYFSHERLRGLDGSQMQDLLHQEAGINWNDYPAWAKRGTFVRRHRILRKFSAEEIDALPPKHAARANPDLEVERSAVVAEDLWLSRIPNREDVLMHGAEPRPPD